jgi:ABC-2 type transport system ATP-binding protein
LIHGGKLVAEGTPDTLKAQVGGERVDLYFDSMADVGRAAALLGSAATPARDDLVLGIPSDGSAAHLHRILDLLRADGIAVSRVSAHRPTLDDVFMTLTGAAPEAEPELAAQSA